MRFPVDNFETQWNTTAGYSFGDKTSYGYHEADDLNINAGGNADLGQPLYAVADGEITSVHTHTGSNTFGKHLHLKFNTDGKDYFAHYAHCDQILVSEGTKVKKGDKIATVGNTGTTYAHCHFAIKNQPTGIDGIAKTLEDLKKWESPIAFIKNHFVDVPMVTLPQAEVDQIRHDRDQHYNDLQKEKEITGKLTSDLQKEQDRTLTLLRELEKLSEQDKITGDMLIDAQKALDPYKRLVGQFCVILGIPVGSTDEGILTALQTLKDQKVKYTKPPILFKFGSYGVIKI